MRVSDNRFASTVTTVYVEIVRNIPLLVVLALILFNLYSLVRWRHRSLRDGCRAKMRRLGRQRGEREGVRAFFCRDTAELSHCSCVEDVDDARVANGDVKPSADAIENTTSGGPAKAFSFSTLPAWASSVISTPESQAQNSRRPMGSRSSPWGPADVPLAARSSPLLTILRARAPRELSGTLGQHARGLSRRRDVVRRKGESARSSGGRGWWGVSESSD